NKLTEQLKIARFLKACNVKLNTNLELLEPISYDDGEKDFLELNGNRNQVFSHLKEILWNFCDKEKISDVFISHLHHDNEKKEFIFRLSDVKLNLKFAKYMIAFFLRKFDHFIF
ncbi:hypothetical protein BpHYR1_046807, partial [Brachionus plicatilis]